MSQMLGGDSDFRPIIRRFVTTTLTSPQSLPRFEEEQWAALAGLGVLSLGTETGGGTAADVAMCMEELGAGGFVGPLVETFIAVQTVTAGDSTAIGRGERIATVTWDAATVPWGSNADIVVLFTKGYAAQQCAVEHVGNVETLAGDPWAAVQLRPIADLGAGHRGVAIGEIALAGYLLGAGLRVVEIAADYARERHQFGRAIGEYQAISHPLAESYARLHAVRDLLWVAASEIDSDDPRRGVPLAARARLLAAQSAVGAAHISIQVHGGMGFVADTFLTHLARRIRYMSLMGPPQWLSEERARPGAMRDERTPSSAI
jgi:alkylation response protein AidB-like acyl-CoA dehydrogenase